MENDWQPVRIAPVNPNCQIMQIATRPDRITNNIGKIVRVRPYLRYMILHEKQYEIHPDDLWILGTVPGQSLLCEHQIQAD